MNVAIKSVYHHLIFQWFGFLHSISAKKEENKKAILANPLLILVVVMAVIMIAWAIGEAICWAHGRSHFVFATKLKAGVFRLGCR